MATMSSNEAAMTTVEGMPAKVVVGQGGGKVGSIRMGKQQDEGDAMTAVEGVPARSRGPAGRLIQHLNSTLRHPPCTSLDTHPWS